MLDKVEPALCHARHRENVCCSPSHLKAKNHWYDKAFHIAEKVAAVAIGVLAAMQSLAVFTPAFTLGVLLGLVTHDYASSSHAHHQEGSCSHGFIEQVTGVKLPRFFALAAGFAVTAAHIDHHSTVFVPIIGLTLGLWAGRKLEPTASLMCHKISIWFAKPINHLVLAANH